MVGAVPERDSARMDLKTQRHRVRSRPGMPNSSGDETRVIHGKPGRRKQQVLVPEVNKGMRRRGPVACKRRRRSCHARGLIACKDSQKKLSRADQRGNPLRSRAARDPRARLRQLSRQSGDHRFGQFAGAEIAAVSADQQMLLSIDQPLSEWRVGQSGCCGQRYGKAKQAPPGRHRQKRPCSAPR